MQIFEKALNDIKPYENNPRNNDNAVSAVVASICEFGFKVPIVIDSDGVIVCGHTRYKAAQEIGLKTVPCVIADDLTPEQVKAFRLADNKVGELATWDFEKLELETAELETVELEKFGFEDVKAEALDIDETKSKQVKTGRTLNIDGTKVIMTDDEYDSLIIRLEEYINQNGVSFGFVRELLNE